jgi:hypothetical protein
LPPELDKSLIFNALRRLPGKVMVFLDSAAGLEAAGSGLRRLGFVGLVNELADAQNGIISFVSSQGSEVSYENADWNNGAFTKALVDGLSGKAVDAGEHEILTIDLYRWLLKRVGSLTDKHQTPIMHGPPSIAPFPLAFVK